jgi:hypothetical protein
MSGYLERIAGKLDRRGRFAFLNTLDRRGARRDDDELDDPFHDGRQTAAQLLRLFVDRGRGWAGRGVDARALDDLYHSETDFDPDGPLAEAFERVLRFAEGVIDHQAPYTTGGTKAKVSKLRLFTLFLALADLADAPDVRVDRELDKVARAFWTANWPTTLLGGRLGKATSRAMIEATFRWFEEHVIPRAGLTFLDPRRSFSEADRGSIWASSAGMCSLCNEDLAIGDAEFDHIIPWIKGGRTLVENGRAVHRSCNRRRGEGAHGQAA